jgi:DNA-binding CsgD family transcriptional regulator/tetratricopeptide (TPR) repeat protein
MPRRLVSPTLVGRAAELAAITGAFDGAATGAPAHRLVAGEAGVGKSRLVAAASAVATARGMHVLTGSCADVGHGGVPYGPIVEALRDLARSIDADELDTIIGGARDDLARLVPSLASGGIRDPWTQTDTLQPRLLEAILGVLQRLAEAAPVVFVVEDLHWADPATRETLSFVTRQLRSDPVVLIMTFRSDELHRRHPLLPWLAELDRSGQVERVDVARLDLAATRDLLTAILEAEPSPDLVERIHRRSDGNPFFVEELLGSDTDVDHARLPPTLREVLLARIVALSERAQSVIGVAAVAGGRVEHALLRRVAGLSDVELIDGLRDAVGSQILIAGRVGDDEAGDYEFRHALLQEAAYDDLLPGERQRLHRSFAEALDERGPGSGAIAAGHWAELAYHWSAARDDRHAFQASVRAGEEAARAYAFADARRHDERALDWWDTVDDPEGLAGIGKVDLLERAALAAWLSGDPRRGVALRREAVAILGPEADPVVLGGALERLGRALWVNTETVPALEAYEAAVAVMPVEPPTRELARVLSGYGQILMLLDRWTESRALCERAAQIARQVGARQVEGHALNTLGIDLSVMGRCSEAAAASDEALVAAREVADADDIGRGHVNRAEARRACGDVRGAYDAAREGITATDEFGVSRTYGGFVRANAVAYGFELGQWAEVTRLADESFADIAVGLPLRRYVLTRWLPLLVAQGDPRAPILIEELRGMVEGFPVETQFAGPYHVISAESAIWQGDPDGAFEIVRRGIAESRDREWPRDHVRLYRIGLRAAADRAEIARALRDAAAERIAVEGGDAMWIDLERYVEGSYADRRGMVASEIDAELATAEAERRRLTNDPAVTSWADAAARWRLRENPYLVAYCRWREAEARLSEGGRGGATGALAEAHAIGSTLGARPLVAAVESLAARSRLDLVGEASPTPAVIATPADPFGLTRRERDVLPLLVKGRTNRQIAEELFISENTAGVHVSNILGKLGASSRTEAAGIAARLGLGLDEG